VDRVLANIVRWVIILALPVFLVLTSARLLVSDWYPHYEYSKAGFPPDPYGFTQQQRLQQLTQVYHYLNSPQPVAQAIPMLKDMRMPYGNGPLFNPDEISHMVDVKRVMDSTWRAQVASAAVLIVGLLFLLLRPATRVIAWNALFGGGLLTAGLLLALGLFVVFGFDTFFTQFHEVFFPQGNWTFDYSDSLIRLLPERFFFDAFTLGAVATLVSAVVLAVIGFVLGRRPGWIG
jgi:integral membrane protein (TIGR01906 family)